jgi:hypothetical protein
VAVPVLGQTVESTSCLSPTGTLGMPLGRPSAGRSGAVVSPAIASRAPVPRSPSGLKLTPSVVILRSWLRSGPERPWMARERGFGALSLSPSGA